MAAQEHGSCREVCECYGTSRRRHGEGHRGCDPLGHAAEKSAALTALPEVQVIDLDAKPNKQAPMRDVQWEIQHVHNTRYALRNTGTTIATGVTADARPFGGLARQLPEDAAVRANSAVEFLLIDTTQTSLPHEMFLTWDGQEEPVAVPIPIGVQF